MMRKLGDLRLLFMRKIKIKGEIGRIKMGIVRNDGNLRYTIIIFYFFDYIVL